VSAGAFDLLALVLLLLAVGWGAWHGAWSQLASLSIFVLSWFGARWVAPHLEGPLAQASAVSTPHLCVTAWALAVLLLLLGLSLIVRLLRGLAKEPAKPGAASRVVGGLLGFAKGLLLLYLLAYGAVLLAPDEQARAWTAGSRVLPALADQRPTLVRLLDLPECTTEAADGVEGRLPTAPSGGARAPGAGESGAVDAFVPGGHPTRAR
jgi:uncharacterized membrane protein required for colicin V production